MIKKIALALCLCGTLLVTGCHDTEKQTPLQQKTAALDNASVAGTYSGTLPAADGPGISVTLTLNADGTYRKTDSYLVEKGIFHEQGPFKLENGMVAISPETAVVLYYRVEPDGLRQLTLDKEPVTGELAPMYFLKKKENKPSEINK